MGGIIAGAFLGYHSAHTLSYEPHVVPPPLWSDLDFSTSSWEEIWGWAKSYTNLHDVPVVQVSSSWKWEQRVGGGWPGLLVLSLWSGFITAISEAMGAFLLSPMYFACLLIQR